MASCAAKGGPHCSGGALRLGRMDGRAARSFLFFPCIHVAYCRSRRTAGNTRHCRRTPSASATCHHSSTGLPTGSGRPDYFRVLNRCPGSLTAATTMISRTFHSISRVHRFDRPVRPNPAVHHLVRRSPGPPCSLYSSLSKWKRVSPPPACFAFMVSATSTRIC